MAENTVRVNWSRGKYSDVDRSDIVDASPLRKGQKVKVIWGENEKQYTAVISCYLEKDDLVPQKARTTSVKRKLVSNFIVQAQT